MYTLGTFPIEHDEEVNRIKLSGLPGIVKFRDINICKYVLNSVLSALFTRFEKKVIIYFGICH